MIDVNLSGPVFDGRAEALAHLAVIDIRHELAERGARLAAGTLSANIRHPRTGRAEASVVIAEHSTTYQSGKYTMPVFVDLGETVVTTDLASYGPWLEGTGSRNFTTRFKGYHSFRLAAQELRAQAQGIAERVIAEYIPEMNA